MELNKRNFIVGLMGWLLAFTYIAFAQQIPNEVGIPPDSPIYGLKKAVESLVGIFMFSDSSKASYNLDLAQKRISEIQYLRDTSNSNNLARNTEKINDLSDDYRDSIGKAESSGAKISNLAQQRDFALLLQTALDHHRVVLLNVRAVVPEQAYPGIDRAISNVDQLEVKVEERKITIESMIGEGNVTKADYQQCLITSGTPPISCVFGIPRCIDGKWECKTEYKPTTTLIYPFPVCGGYVGQQCPNGYKCVLPENCQDCTGKCEIEYRPTTTFLACPAVCRPMYVKSGAECIFTDCGSGCGPDKISTFSTLEECVNAPIPTEPTLPKEIVCCKIFGLGAYSQEVYVKYEQLNSEECRIPEGFTGGGRTVVSNDYCKTFITSPDEFADLCFRSAGNPDMIMCITAPCPQDLSVCHCRISRYDTTFRDVYYKDIKDTRWNGCEPNI